MLIDFATAGWWVEHSYTILASAITSGLMANFVTQRMIMRRQELDFIRAKLEELHAAVHSYLLSVRAYFSETSVDYPYPTFIDLARTPEAAKERADKFERIQVLVTLYFREANDFLHEMGMRIDKASLLHEHLLSEAISTIKSGNANRIEMRRTLAQLEEFRVAFLSFLSNEVYKGRTLQLERKFRCFQKCVSRT